MACLKLTCHEHFSDVNLYTPSQKPESVPEVVVFSLLIPVLKFGRRGQQY